MTSFPLWKSQCFTCSQSFLSYLESLRCFWFLKNVYFLPVCIYLSVRSAAHLALLSPQTLSLGLGGHMLSSAVNTAANRTRLKVSFVAFEILDPVKTSRVRFAANMNCLFFNHHSITGCLTFQKWCLWAHRVIILILFMNLPRSGMLEAIFLAHTSRQKHLLDSSDFNLEHYVLSISI
jgi:hypothetical protein